MSSGLRQLEAEGAGAVEHRRAEILGVLEVLEVLAACGMASRWPRIYADGLMRLTTSEYSTRR